ncbi:hypothetical protein GGR58DRAFT_12197 [Xylaria digitata]|nr:hypothetical protein GGR58DRAFT_12197 [Xylaria digitata]
MFVVDGLGECAVRENGGKTSYRDSLLEFFKSFRHIVSKSKSRLLVVSRNEQEIREGLDSNKTIMECELVELQILPQDVECDIASDFSCSNIKGPYNPDVPPSSNEVSTSNPTPTPTPGPSNVESLPTSASSTFAHPIPTSEPSNTTSTTAMDETSQTSDSEATEATEVPESTGSPNAIRRRSRSHG